MSVFSSWTASKTRYLQNSVKNFNVAFDISFYFGELYAVNVLSF
jgi:hypothetical protein